MTKVSLGKGIGTGRPVELDLESLIDTRMLVQANSGGGKSYFLRKLLEQTHGHVQHIILDLEGEFGTLREKYDYLLVGKGGDIDISIRVADILARKLLELGVSAIIDLYELKQHERILFVKRFLDSMINVSKELWHPCIVVVDEAHIFCPEHGKAESAPSVIDLCTRGRKRGYAAVLATQRLSKLSKDACAELNNKSIGRTGLDIDMKRASEELGFSSKEQMLSLRNLAPGEFYYFGPALSTSVELMKVGEVQTTHPKSGQRILKTVTPPTHKVQEMLKKLTDLPQEAEKELKTVEEFRSEIHKLKMENRRLAATGGQAVVPRPVGLDSRMIAERDALKNEIRELKIQNREFHGRQNALQKKMLSMSKIATRTAEEIGHIANGPYIPVYTKPEQTAVKTLSQPTIERSEPIPWPRDKILKPYSEPSFEGGKPTGGALRMLQAAAMFWPGSVTRFRMGLIARLSPGSGTFGTYLAILKRDGLIEGDNSAFTITEAGLQQAGTIPKLPEGAELVEMWKSIVKGGAARMLQVLAEIYPEGLDREELGMRAEISPSSGTFGTYLATLKRSGLVEVSGRQVKVTKEMYE